MAGGTEWLVDAYRCDPARLASPRSLRELSDGVIERLGLHVLGPPVIHQFPSPGGVTGLYLLSESHWAWHTYPESALATFNLYCCRARQPLDWPALLGAALGARRVEVTCVQRGLGLSPASTRAGHPQSPPESARDGAQPGSGK